MNTTLKILQEVFQWTGMQKEVKEFVKQCLHCLVVNGKTVPRPFGATLKATKPNEILHFDFLTLPVSTEGYKYVLVLKDGMSGFVELIPCARCTAEEVVRGLTDWFKRFGPVAQWVSDQGAHFKNQVVDALCKLWGAQHHFVTAYCPWANGTVEVVNRMLLRVLKSMLSEKKLKTNQWPVVLPMVQAALDLQPSSRLNGVAPLTAFAALPAKTPLNMYYATHMEADLPTLTPATYTEAVKQHLQELEVSLEQLHTTLTTVSTARAAHPRAVSQKFPFPNFEIGDFVLVGRVLARPNKLALEWTGPCRVVGVRSHWLYDVQTLFEPVTTTLHHISRLQFYAEASRAVVSDLVAHAVAHQEQFLVESLVECRQVETDWEILVKWQGFSLDEATWEPLSTLQLDVPTLLNNAVATSAHPSFHALKTFLAAHRAP
jgi:transposase InsO family protein